MTIGIAKLETVNPTFGFRIPSLINLTLILLPFWWFLGVEQFIWLLAFAVLSFFLFYGKTVERLGVSLPSPAGWTLAFLLIQLLSSFFIVETAWVLVFIRNFGIWVGGLCLFVLVVNLVSFESKEFDALLRTLLTVSLLSCLVCFVAVFGLWDPHFTSPLAHVLPSSIAESEFAQAMIERSWTALKSKGMFGIEFDRPRAFFSYPNPFAGFLVITLPLTLYFARKRRSFLSRVFWVGAAALMGLSLVLTMSRAAILSLLAGSVVVRRRLPGRIRLVVYVVVAGVLLEGLFIVSDRLPEVTEESTRFIDQFANARGQSLGTRMTIYLATLESWRERPVLGWGTQRPPAAVGLPPYFPPIGSHSNYLAILYRHGIVGLLVYLLLILSVFRRFRRPDLTSDRSDFLLYAKWAFLGNIVHMILMEIDLDAILLTTTFLLWSMIVVAAGRGTADPPKEMPNGI